MGFKFNPTTGELDLTGGGASGPAGGDLAGFYPDPTLSSAKQSYLLDRANHTGTQTAATITGLAAIATSGNASDLITGTTAVARGGTGTGSTPTNGQLLIGNGTGYSLSTLTAGSGISISNGTGTVTISSTASGTVTSVDASGGTTGLTFSGGPITTSGILTLAGILIATNGGTGVSSTPTNGQLLIGNGTGYTLSTLVAGTNIGITNGAGTITITNTTPVLTYLSDWVSPNNYIGQAPDGSATSSAVWTVRKITVSSGGAVTFYGTATPIKWDDRYTAVYT